jgi:excisionase family DNA binding protein
MSILTVSQVAAMLACTEATVRELLNAGHLPGVKYGRDWVIPLEALLERVNQAARKNVPVVSTVRRTGRVAPALA